MKPIEMQAVIEGKRYNTQTAILIADNGWWDGHNHERHGRNSFLYRTPRGAYFFMHRTCWEGENDRIETCSPDEAASFYESVQAHEDCVYLPYAEAFPSLKIEDA